MQQLKSLIYSIIVVAGLTLLWVVESSMNPAPPSTQDAMLVTIDGKIPPPLSDFPMHRAFIDEATCLRCHQNGKEMNFGGQTLIAPKIKHEFRENCIRCHQLPQ